MTDSRVRPSIQAQFEIKSTEPALWVLSGDRLLAAAEVVLDQYDRASERVVSGKTTSLQEARSLEMIVPASLLFGLALENVLKARLIQLKKPKPADVASLFPGSSHNLVALADAAGITLTVQERDLLNRLWLNVEWAAKYPVPKSTNRMVTDQIGVAIVEKTTDPVTGREVEVRHPYLPMPLQSHEKALFDTVFQRVRELVVNDTL